MAIKTGDMPVVASVGVAVAMYAMATGDPSDAAEILGAAANVRGAEDLTQPDIAHLQQQLTNTLGPVDSAAAYARGRALDRDRAVARQDPAQLGRIRLA